MFTTSKQCSAKLPVFLGYLGRVGKEWKGRIEDLELVLSLLSNVANQLVMFSSNNFI